MDVRRRALGGAVSSTSSGGGSGGSNAGTYNINLNNQWRQSTSISNPDSSLYDGVYESNSNYNVNNSGATMYIDIDGYSEFSLYIRSYAEGSFDYVMVSQLDQTINNSTTYSNTTLVKAHTRGNQQSGTTLSNYTLVEFTNIDGGSHRITIVYRKDSSSHNGTDRGYVLIPKTSGGDIEIDGNKSIIYTSTDGKVVTPYITTGFSKNIVTNIYSNGKGIIQLNSPLKKLDDSGFRGRLTLSTILLPDTTEEIGGYAFYSCSGLTNANIGCNVTSIGYYAFNGCNKLTGISIPDSVTSIGYCAFSYCSSLTSITIPGGVTIIDNNTFSNSGLISVTIPDSVTEIGSYAFSNCNSLSSVTIPDSVTKIGSYAFSNCNSLPSLTIPISVTYFGARVFSGFTGTLILNCETIPYSTVSPNPFDGMLSDTIILSETVKTIDRYSLSGSNIKYINIPDNVTVIGERAFSGCKNLQEVYIGEGITSLGGYAFIGCSSLNKIVLSEKFEDLNNGISSGITNLDLYCKPLTPPKNGYQTLSTISGKCNAYIPYKSTYAYKYGHRWKYSSGTTMSNKVTIIPYDFVNNQPAEEPIIQNNELWYISPTDEVITPYDVSGFNTTISSNTYLNGSGIIKTKAAITKIGSSAFYNKDIVHVLLPKTVTSIGNSAFTSTDIYDIVVPENVTSIGSYAFSNCRDLLNVSLPEGLKTIGAYAFENCYDIDYIRIPDTVTTIGDDALKHCSCTLDLGNGCPTITTSGWGYDFTKIVGKYASSDNRCYIKDGVLILFASGSGASSYNIPDGVKTIGKNSFIYYVKLKSITIPDSVTSIGENAFYNCTGITSVEMGNGVTTIETGAFGRNLSLSSITFSNQLKTIKRSAITSIKASSIILPDSVETVEDYAFSSGEFITFTFGTKIKSIGTWCFSHCSSITDLYVKAITPPTCGSSIFANGATPTIHVPSSSVEAYKTKSGWSSYKDYIVGYDFT